MSERKPIPDEKGRTEHRGLKYPVTGCPCRACELAWLMNCISSQPWQAAEQENGNV